MKKRVLWLVLSVMLLVPALCLAAQMLPLPENSREIHTEWKLWDDGIPVRIEDGGPYNLGKGKTGYSITISGLSALAAKTNGDVYLYSAKKRTFEKMKNAKREPEKDRIRLVFSELPEEIPYKFYLPVQNLFPKVWICFDRITGNLWEQVRLEMPSEEGAVVVWNDGYRLEYYMNEDESVRAQYGPDGKLTEAEYVRWSDDVRYSYNYRWRTLAYGRHEIAPVEIRITGDGTKVLKLTGDSWQEADSGRPAAEIVGNDFNFAPCIIVGDPVITDNLPDPPDTSWLTFPDISEGIPAEIPALTAVPAPPLIRQETTEDGRIRQTLDGLYYWGVNEEDLCEWTWSSPYDLKSMTEEEIVDLYFELRHKGEEIGEWSRTGESKGDRLLTVTMPADDITTSFTLRMKDGEQIWYEYQPEEETLILDISKGDMEYNFVSDTGKRTEIRLICSSDDRFRNASYNLSDGQLTGYSALADYNGTEIEYSYTVISPTEQQLSEVLYYQDDLLILYFLRGSSWYSIDPETGTNTECGVLPEDLAAVCVPLTVK